MSRKPLPHTTPPAQGDDGDHYAVGYGKPPAHGRFKPGQSGNPSGRPKGRRNVASALQTALNERVTITENGVRKNITKLDAAIKQVVNRSAAGDNAATKLLLQLFPWLDKLLDQQDSRLTDPEVDRAILDQLSKRLLAVGVDDAGPASDADSVNDAAPEELP